MDMNEDNLAFEDDSIREFREAVAEGAPDELEVLPAPDGFEVVYREELTQRGLLMRIDSTYWAVVKCDPVERTFIMEDRGATQHASLATLRFSKSTFRGRAYEKRTVSVFGRRDDGSLGKVDSQTQDTRVLHNIIRQPAEALRWTEKQPAAATIGKIVAGIAGGGLVIAGIVVGILFLTGTLP